jgi:hypothetical protein
MLIVPAGCGFFGDERYADNSLDPQYSSVLKQLCLVYPQSATHEDADGQNPIEVALADTASDCSTARVLQKAARKHWKQIKQAEHTTSIAPITEDARYAVIRQSA